MKVIYWNVRAGIIDKPAKQHKLFNFESDADIIILAEAEKPEYKGLNYNSFVGHGYELIKWVGKCDYRGLIAFAKPGVINKEFVSGNARHYSLVLPINNSNTAIVGIWSKSKLVEDTEKNDYCNNMYNCLNDVVKYLANPIVIGDFNMSPRVSGQETKAIKVFKEFEACGLHSFYHSILGEEYGKESSSSYWDSNGGFMLDHIFAKKEIIDNGYARWPFTDKEYWAAKGKPDECSDHLPIMLEF